MIRLDALLLNPSLNWVERYNSAGVAQTIKTTLGGRPTVNSAPLIGGQDITLVAYQDSGWLNKTMLMSLLEMASVPGKVMLLTYHGDLSNVPVVFRHNEPPAVEFRALSPRSYPADQDYFFGTIKLVQV